MVLGALLAFAGGYAASRWGRTGIALVVVGSLLGGGGFAALVRGWELRVRTPLGSGLWLRVESFRRFLHESETFHAEEAAKRGVLREYTAWAVALGEIDRWERAVARLDGHPRRGRPRLRAHGPDAHELHGVDGHRPVLERRRGGGRFGRRRRRGRGRRELVARG